MYEYNATLEHIVDGDTYDFEVDLGLRVYTKTRVRLRGIDTPEIHGVRRESREWARGDSAKRFVEGWFEEHGAQVQIRTHKDRVGKYGRWLADILASDDGSNLGDDLLSAGHAERVAF